MTEPRLRWHDWPIDHRRALCDAVRAIPGAERLSDDDVDGYARSIAAVADLGHDEQLPRFRDTSPAATEKQLLRIGELAAELDAQIAALNAPAVAGLARNGVDAFDMQRHLERLQAAAHHAFTGSRLSRGKAEGKSAGGRPRKVAAAEITAAAAEVFEEITGAPPSFTSDPETGGVSGDWPTVLGLVLDALLVEASVAAQVRVRVREKTPRKKSD
jgi:hypothetical protein